jgi:Aerotolerance regulator N-terminal/von Willebrand factor type A domain/UvrB interaction domain
MSWISALSWGEWAVMTAVPLGIVLLYFLKLRREPVEVPSTYLWSQTIEDLHVNSLLQRLRRSLLLFLQLLAVALAALALFRPGLQGETSGQGRMVFLLDNSASMQATDVEGDDNRFEQARRMIAERIDRMSDTDTAMLVTFSDRPDTVQSFTSDRGRLRDALSRVTVSNQTTDILGALKAADGLANPRRTSEVGNINDVQVADAMPADLLIFSDGRFQTSSLRTLSAGDEVNREILLRWLNDVGYQSAEQVNMRSQYAKVGDHQLEVFPPTGAKIGEPVRIEWAAGKISSIKTFDPNSGVTDQIVEKLDLPALAQVQNSAGDFNLGNLVPKYFRVGSDAVRNLAITTFSAERNVEQPNEVQAYATIVNLGSVPMQSTATLSMNNTFLDAETVSLEPGEQTGLSFTIESEEAATLQVKLDSKDDLALDNTAFAGLAPMRYVSVLVVTSGNTPLEIGLSTDKSSKVCRSEFVSPSYLESQEYKTRAEAGTDDLIIYDRCSPAVPPMTNTFYIAALPPNSSNSDTAGTTEVTPEAGAAQPDATAVTPTGWSWGTEASAVQLVDVDRTHPLMLYLELYRLLIYSGRAVQGPPGSTELIGADVGPVLVLAPRDGYQDLVLGFEIISSNAEGVAELNTNWFAERSWPVFVFNVLRHLAGAAEATGAPTYRPGETVRLRLESALSEVQVQREGGEPFRVATGASGVTEIVDTSQPGNYRVMAGDRLADLYAINLFDRSESDIAASPSVDIGFEAVEGAEGGVEKRREYWRLALLIMLGLLATEWWVYTKRVG